MIKLTTNYEQREIVIQPDFSRSRAVYRSPIRSESLNLTADQLRYDHAKLKYELKTLRSDMENYLSDLKDGGADEIKSEIKKYLASPTGRAATPDNTDFTISQNVNIVAKISVDSFAGADRYIAAQRATGSDISFGLFMSGPNLQFRVSITGSAYTGSVNTTADLSALGIPTNIDFYVAATLELDNGSGQNVRTLYYSLNGKQWVQLGTNSTDSGAIITVFNSTASMGIGSLAAGSAASRWEGRISYVKLRTGLVPDQGVVKFDFDMNSWSSGNSFVRGGRTWTAVPGAAFTSGPVPRLLEVNSLAEISSRIRDITDRIHILETKRGL